MKHAVPHKIQSNPYNCGPTCLEMLLDFYGVQHDVGLVEELCHAEPGRGTENSRLVQAAAHFGMRPVARENASLQDVISAIESGHPVLVNYFNCKSDVGHFAVTKGVDLREEALLLADPKNGDDYSLTFDHFQHHWHNHTKTIHAWMMHITTV